MRESKYIRIEEVKRETVREIRGGESTRVYFRIVDQSHRGKMFGGKIVGDTIIEGESFTASNGVHLLSRGMIQPKPLEKTLFVRGTSTEYDFHAESCPLDFFEKIVVAIEEYNRYYWIHDFDLPENLFHLE